MHTFKKKVLETIQKEKLFTKKDSIIISFSGGVDSVTLVCILLDLNYTNIELVYFNHNLRSSKEICDEIRFVKQFSKEKNTPLTIRKLPVKYCQKKFKISMESAAHILRKKMLQHLATIKRKTVILTAHHQDDLIETLFIQLQRGQVYHLGLPIKRLDNGITIARPLLPQSKHTLISYCQQKKQSWSSDETNNCVKITRNNIRHKLLPLIKKFDPKIAHHLLTLFQRSQELHLYDSNIIKQNKISILQTNKALQCDMSSLIDLPSHTQASLVFKIIYGFYKILYPQKKLKQNFMYKFSCSQTTITNLVDALRKNSMSKKFKINNLLTVNLINKELYYNEETNSQQTHTLKLNQSIKAFNNNIKLTACKQMPTSFKSSTTHCFFQTTYPNITVSTLKPTDMFTPYKKDSSVNIKKYLSKKQIPYHRKVSPLIFKQNQNVIWVPEIGVSNMMLCDHSSLNIYKIELETLTKPITHMIS